MNRTRLAPTPSGYLHIGNLRSFVLTARLARETGANVLLRIDDMDRERVEDRYLQDIFDTLAYMEIDYTEGPGDVPDFKVNWSQERRLPLYNTALGILRNQASVFACTCSRADVLRVSPGGAYPGTCRSRDIPLDAPGVSWRLKTNESGGIAVRTFGTATVSATLPEDMVDFVVRKKDGFPAYQLTSLVDDVHFGVDLVVRGADLWHSTLAQLYLAQVLGYNTFLEATFHHHPLITDSGGAKLSKSAGATSIQYLRTHGATLQDVLKMAGF